MPLFAGFIAIVTMIILAYAWIFYPFFLRFLVRRCSGMAGTDAAASPSAEQPEVAVIIAAYNEADVIEKRLFNLAEQHYPLSKITLYLGDDGSSDGTPDLVARWQKSHPGLSLVVKSFNRQGKMATLKHLVRLAKEPILVFSDANTMFDSHAIAIMVAALQRPGIGCVCGRLILEQPTQTPFSAEEKYWERETQWKGFESTVDSCLGVNGAIYALRRELFPDDLPDNVIIDDFVIGMRVRQKGWRVAYHPEALAKEPLPQVTHEFNRRVRIGTGAYQALWLCRRLLLPRYGVFALMFWSHKVLRWITPHLLILWLCAAWAVSLWCLGIKASAVILAVLLAVGALGAFLFARVQSSFSQLWLHFLRMNTGLLVGFFQFCMGRTQGSWGRTPRN